MTTPRLAVIGVGHWGRNLVRNFDRLGALAGICDVRDAARRELADEFPAARVFETPSQVLAASDIDAVAIATPAATHGQLVAASLAAGKHVFVEKPLCLDLDEGRALGREAARRGLTLMVGHLLLYHPAFIALSELVASGRLGPLRYIYSNRLSLGRIRREENALWSFAPHDVSMILSLMAALPETVMTSGGAYLAPKVADTTLTHLGFAGGVQAHIFVSWLHPFKDHRLVVVGSDGMAVFHDSQAGLEKLLLYPHNVGWDGGLPNVDKAEAEPVPYGAGEPLAVECRHFLDRVVDGAPPRSNAEEGLRVLTVLDACQRSMGSGAPVRLASTGIGTAA